LKDTVQAVFLFTLLKKKHVITAGEIDFPHPQKSVVVFFKKNILQSTLNFSVE